MASSVTLSSNRLLVQVGRNLSALKESFYLIRSSSSVAERTDFDNVFDGVHSDSRPIYDHSSKSTHFSVGENGWSRSPNVYGQNPHSFSTQNDKCGGSFGGNFSGVNYDQNYNGVNGLNPSEHYGNGNVSPGYFGNGRQIEGPQFREKFSIGGSSRGSEGSLGTSIPNHYGERVQGGADSLSWKSQQSMSGFSESTWQQKSPNYFAGNTVTSDQNFGGNYVGKYQQNIDGGYHPDPRSYQQGWSEAKIDGAFDFRATSDKPNEEPFEASQGSQSMIRVEVLDELCKEGKMKEAVELLGQLERHGILVDLPRYFVLMKTCGENKALEEAKAVHEYLLKSVPNPEVRIYNKILEMYSRCGSMDDAFAVFDQMPKRNLTSWDILIYWLAKNDHGEDSIDLFEQFKKSGLKPDGQMFFGVFFACGVLCEYVEGILHFESMSKDFGIVPSVEHYASMVNMLGSAGCLDEALEFIEKMPVEPGVEIWETLMNCCRAHGNTELGDRCADIVQLLDPSRLNEQSREGLIPINTSEIAREKERKKLSGQNLLEVRSRVHEYRAGDRSHPDHEKIYALLSGLKQQMKEVGYVSETKFVLHDVDIESKEEALMAHSERLAAAQGFMTTPARSPLRIIKNLRVCGDCHNAFKIISNIVGRELIARDSKRFHHFKDGVCSCNDYW